MKAHRTHVYQLLVNELGMDHWRVSVAFGMVQLVVGGGFFAMRSAGLGTIMGYWLVCLTLWGIIDNRIRGQAYRICAPDVQNDLENSY